MLNCYAFAGIGGVVVAVVRDLNDTHQFVVGHNTLGAVMDGSACRYFTALKRGIPSEGTYLARSIENSKHCGLLRKNLLMMYFVTQHVRNSPY